MVKVGKTVRKLRGEKTQVEFARLLGTCQSVISEIEVGIKEPSKELAKKLSILSGLPLENFIR